MQANLGSHSLDFNILKKHFVALGGSGSGKTYLCKVLIEECAIKGIPAICVDSQNDIASLINPSTPEDLAKHGISKDLLKDFVDKVEVVLFTPTSDAGIPLSVNPLAADTTHLQGTDRIKRYSALADMVAGLVDMGENDYVIAAINLVLEYWG